MSDVPYELQSVYARWGALCFVLERALETCVTIAELWQKKRQRGESQADFERRYWPTVACTIFLITAAFGISLMEPEMLLLKHICQSTLWAESWHWLVDCVVTTLAVASTASATHKPLRTLLQMASDGVAVLTTADGKRKTK